MTEQGVLRHDRLRHLLVYLALLFSCITSSTPSADETQNNVHNVFIMQSSGSNLPPSISRKLTGLLHYNHKLNIVQITPQQNREQINDQTDVIVSIGTEAIRSADKHYPSSRKLYITSYLDPQSIEKIKRESSSILYMTQPLCRQLKLIKLVEESWQTIGLLYTDKKSEVVRNIKPCADEFKLDIYAVKKEADESLSDSLKDVLMHADVLLALPDTEIYNGNTVKNILLTSYRLRKPVFAFSENFVTAGALASIHSNSEQIAESAKDIITHYFENELRFERTENYPQTFDVDINKHVTKALDLKQQNIYRLEAILGDTEYPETGKRK